MATEGHEAHHRTEYNVQLAGSVIQAHKVSLRRSSRQPEGRALVGEIAALSVFFSRVQEMVRSL
jgi:hypothetical protein